MFRISSLFPKRRPQSLIRDYFDNRSILLNRVGQDIDEKFSRNDLATIVTPTTGNPLLYYAIKSVLEQSYGYIEHWVIADGPNYAPLVSSIIQKFDDDRLKLMVLPNNTGKHGYNGHRIYAAIPFLINSEFILFLDEDNWWDRNHVQSLIDTIKKEDLDWAFSMRKICKENGHFVVNDDCESIGDYPSFSGRPSLVDTNCYAFRRTSLLQSAHYWYHPLQADRYFFYQHKRKSPRFLSTGLYTVNYRLSNSKPPFSDFFIEGNKAMFNIYDGKLPWLSKGI